MNPPHPAGKNADLYLILDAWSEELSQELVLKYVRQGLLHAIKGLRPTKKSLETCDALAEALKAQKSNVVFWLLDQGLNGRSNPRPIVPTR